LQKFAKKALSYFLSNHANLWQSLNVNYFHLLAKLSSQIKLWFASTAVYNFHQGFHCIVKNALS